MYNKCRHIILYLCFQLSIIVLFKINALDSGDDVRAATFYFIFFTEFHYYFFILHGYLLRRAFRNGL